MRKITILLVLFGLLTMFGVVSAQETEEPTDEATVEVTPEPTAASPETDVTAEVTPDATDEADTFIPTVLVRIAHFASDAPALSPFVNGQPSGIQDLAFPSISGWVQIPEGASLSLVPQGGTADDAVVGPVSVDSSGRWGTIAVVGSQAAGTLSAYLIHENLGALPDGCASVTVFHGIEGGPAFDVAGMDGTVFGSSVGFPGADNAVSVPLTGASGQCATASDSMPTDEMAATEEASDDMAATEEAVEVMSANQTGSVVGCTVVPVGLSTGASADDMSDAVATEEAADASATQEASATEETSMDASTTSTDTTAVRAPSLRQGQRVANCAYTFLIPAGAAGINANAAGASDVLWTLLNTEVEANTYYFIAVIGTADAPQVFNYSVGGGTLDSVRSGAEDVEASDLIAESEETPEVTPDSTEEGS